MLSHRSAIPPVLWYWIDSKNAAWYAMVSCAAADMVMHSASTVERATVWCLLQPHDTAPCARLYTQPVQDQRLSSSEVVVRRFRLCIWWCSLMCHASNVKVRFTTAFQWPSPCSVLYIYLRVVFSYLHNLQFSSVLDLYGNAGTGSNVRVEVA